MSAWDMGARAAQRCHSPLIALVALIALTDCSHSLPRCSDCSHVSHCSDVSAGAVLQGAERISLTLRDPHTPVRFPHNTVFAPHCGAKHPQFLSLSLSRSLALSLSLSLSRALSLSLSTPAQNTPFSLELTSNSVFNLHVKVLHGEVLCLRQQRGDV